MVFCSAPDHLYQLKSIQIGYSRRVVQRSWRLAAMLLDHPIASKPSGDLFVNEVTCLDQKVA